MWNHKGISISVNSGGKFVFEEKGEDGETVTSYHDSLEQANKAIEAYLTRTKPEDLALECLAVLMNDKEGTYPIVELLITGINGNTGGLRYKPKTADVHYGPFPKSSEIREKLREYVRLRVGINALQKDLDCYRIPEWYGYGRVDMARMPDKLQKLLQDYSFAVNGSMGVKKSGG